MNVDDPKLAELLGNAPPAPRADFSVACIHFPAYHRSPYMEALFGFGWSEWELVRRAQPRFPGHRQPIEPLWGYYDESDPAWAAREIDAAADHGIDAFVIDWYWHCGHQFYHEQLERGFLQADNRDRIKFAIMWANHTWKNNFPAPLHELPPTLLPMRHSLEDLDRVVDYCTEHYFNQPNYWRLDGRPCFSFFNARVLIDELGGDAGLAGGLERMRRRAERNGLPGLYLGCLSTPPGADAEFRRLGFDHVGNYGLNDVGRRPRDTGVAPYEEMLPHHVRRWLGHLQDEVPYWPMLQQGFDNTARIHPYEPWPPTRWEWPISNVISGNTPERFGRLVYAARRFLARQSAGPKVMLLNAWNEWTEGAVLCPTKDQGFGALEALKAALGDCPLPGRSELA